MKNTHGTFIYPDEYEKASNSYLMSTVTVIAGLPLPIVNVLAGLGFYLANRKASYFVRWHCIQAVLSQVLMLPFNSILLAWTLSYFWDGFPGVSNTYIIYAFTVLTLNVIEFLSVLLTAIKVRNGGNPRWPVLAGITDRLTSTDNRDKFRI